MYIGAPNPFPVPTFRRSTEANLESKVLTESDQKYVVQTLATMLMSYVQRPSLKLCLVVSRALHEKFRFLGDESFEVKFNVSLFYIYTAIFIEALFIHIAVYNV